MFIEEKIDRMLALLEGIVKASEGPSAVSAVKSEPPAAAPDADPFAEESGVTMDDVRKHILALRDATDQATALGVLKKHGASSFADVKTEAYSLIVRDAQNALAANVPVDPFAELPPVGALSKALTFEDLKDAVKAAQKRTGTSIVQKVVMEHGGKTPGAGGAMAPSLKAVPLEQYAAAIRAIQALPSTK